jgi:hypothetical protein
MIGGSMRITGYVGEVICHKYYVAYLRTIPGIRCRLVDILDWEKGIGQWAIYRMFK